MERLRNILDKLSRLPPKQRLVALDLVTRLVKDGPISGNISSIAESFHCSPQTVRRVLHTGTSLGLVTRSLVGVVGRGGVLISLVNPASVETPAKPLVGVVGRPGPLPRHGYIYNKTNTLVPSTGSKEPKTKTRNIEPGWLDLADRLRQSVLSSLPDLRIRLDAKWRAYRTGWAEHLRLLHTADAVPLEVIGACIDYLPSNPFWSTRIQSAKSFRRNYDMINVNRTHKPKPRNSKPQPDVVRTY